MLLLLIFIIILWASISALGYTRKSWITIIPISIFSMMLYFSNSAMLLILGWSGMGSFSAGLVAKKSINKVYGRIMVLWSTISTLFIILGLCKIKCWNISDFYIEHNPYSDLFILIGVSIKSLIWPQSYWLFSAMKGISPMSSLVHSLSVVFGGTYIIIILTEEGWIGVNSLCIFSLCSILSTIPQTWGFLSEVYPKRILGCSTTQSINTINSLMYFDPQICFGYALLHGMSKAGIFIYHNQYSKFQHICLLLLGGFPMTITYFTKHCIKLFIIKNFILWISISYSLLIFKYYENIKYSRNYNSKSVIEGILLLWISIGSIIGSLGPIHIEGYNSIFVSIFMYKLLVK